MKLHGLAALAMAAWGAWAAGGCCTPVYYGDCGPHGIAAGPGPCCIPPATGESVSPQCVACGVNGPCPKHPGGRGLFTHLGIAAGCGAGCGEFYLHPWLNDPPHPCDPCDHHGNWIGPHPCEPEPCAPAPCAAPACPVGWHNLWGHRSDLAACCGGVGCHECGHAAGAYPVEHHDGEVIYGPTPAEAPMLAPPRGAEEIETPDATPEPPAFPGPANGPGSGAPVPRSTLKKIENRPAAYQGRASRAAQRRSGTVLR